jgi:hypothetical protein
MTTSESSIIERGHCYRHAHPGLFGTLGAEWIVDAVFRGTDGVPYARLICAWDLSLRKTLSLYALNDRRRFLRVSSRQTYFAWQAISSQEARAAIGGSTQAG